MSVNLDKIRQKLEALKNGNGGGNSFWKPNKDKPSTIRMVAYNPDDPFPTFWMHYNIGQSFACPRNNFKKACPACELAEKLKKSGDPVDAEQAKKFYAKQRYFAVVVDRSDEQLTPKFWGFSFGMYLSLMEKFNDPDYQTYMDENEGLDAVVILKAAGGAKKFPEPELTFKRKESPIAASAKEIARIKSEIKKIESCFQVVSAEDIKSRIDETLSTGTETATDSPEEVKGGKKVTEAKAQAVTSKKKTQPAVEESEDDDIESRLDDALAEIDLDD